MPCWGMRQGRCSIKGVTRPEVKGCRSRRRGGLAAVGLLVAVLICWCRSGQGCCACCQRMEGALLWPGSGLRQQERRSTVGCFGLKMSSGVVGHG